MGINITIKKFKKKESDECGRKHMGFGIR